MPDSARQASRRAHPRPRAAPVRLVEGRGRETPPQGSPPPSAAQTFGLSKFGIWKNSKILKVSGEALKYCLDCF